MSLEDDVKEVNNDFVYKKFAEKQNTADNVIFKELDGDSQEKEIDLFSKNFNKKIDGYPTIILVKENDVIEFDAEPTEENLEAFIKSTL